MSKLGRIVRIVLAVWATYRLASMVSHDEGPYLSLLYKDDAQTGLFEKIRIELGVYDYGRDGKPDTNLARGISCPLCTGVYLSALLAALVFVPSKVGDFFLTWIGIAGAQVFLENLTSDEAIEGAIQDVAESMEEQDD